MSTVHKGNVMNIDPETTATAGVGATGIIGGFFMWLRSIGSRITNLETKMNNITSIDKSPFVLTKTFEKTCQDIDNKCENIQKEIKDINKNVSEGFGKLDKTICQLKCQNVLKEESKVVKP